MEKLYLIHTVSRSWRADLLKDFENKITLNKVYSALDCFFSATMTADIANELERDVRVITIEEEKEFSLDNTRGVPSATGNYGIDRIDQRFLPLDSKYTSSRTGVGVDIYIQDTGIRSTHREFIGPGGGTRVEDLFKAGFTTFEDEHGHGSHVSGIAAGNTFGVAPDARLLTVRSFSANGTATNTALLGGFEAILEHHQAKNGSRPSVVNMSFSGRASTLINNAIKALIDGGAFSSFSVFNNGVGDWRADSFPAQIGYEFANPSPVITRYNITTVDDDMAPKDWTFEGSTDGISYAVLDTKSNQTNWAGKQSFFIGNTTSYSHYKLNITANNGNASFTRITQLEFTDNVVNEPSDLVPKMIDFNIPQGIVFSSHDLTYSGIVVCVAAGNSDDEAVKFSPASLLEAITVAASGKTDEFAFFSNTSTDVFILSGLDATNFGSSVDIIAPGISIRSVGISTDTSTLVLTGTSMSSPHVAGVCALFLEANPTATPAQVQKFITDNATEGVISLSTRAIDTGTPNLLLYSNFAEPDFVLSWITVNGNLGFTSEGISFNFQLVAQSVDNLDNSRIVIYKLINGELPPGLSMTDKGLIDGIVSENITNSFELFSFTIQATDRISTQDRTFDIVVLNTNRAPEWVTPNINPIGTFFEGEQINFQLEAVDPDAIDIVIYTLETGSLPPGLFVNTSGFINGVIGKVISTTLFAFTMKASDPFGNFALRNFSMIIESFAQPLLWRTGPGSLGDVNENDAFEFQLDATSRDTRGDERNITFSIVSGTLPLSIAMGIDGLIQGFADPITLVGTIEETSSFTVNIDDGIDSINRTFTITVLDINQIPEWTTPPGTLGEFTEGDVINIPLVASDPDAELVTFNLLNGGLPPDIILSSSGVISGTIGTIIETINFEFTVRITDTKNFVDRTFTIFVNNINNPPVFITNIPIKFDGFDFIGLFREGDFIDFQFEGLDLEGDPLTFSLGNGSIPDDLILEPGGRLVGFVSSIFTSIIEDVDNQEPDPSTAGFFNNKRFRFDVALSDGENTVTKGFQITITDVPKGPLPVWISPEDLGTFIEGEPIFIALSATSFLVPQEDIFFTEVAGFGLPAGLTLDTDGEIFGSIPDVTVDTVFNIRLEANVFVITVSNFDPDDAEASFAAAGISGDTSLIVYVFDDIIDTFYIFNGIFGEVFVTNLTAFDPNDSEQSFIDGGILDPSGISFVFDTTDTIYYHLDNGTTWVEIINTPLTNFDPDEPEASFIAGGILTGFETINFVLETSTDDFFFVSNEFEVLEIIEFKTAKDFFFRVLNRENLDIPEWITPEGLLGAIDVYDDSLFILEGTTDTGLALTFDLINGELPPGLSLDGSGIIIGTIVSNAITTQFYEFTVEIKTAFNTSLPRTFQIDVNRYFNDPDAVGSIANVCIPITGDIKERLNEHELIPLEFLFRPTDPNFGRIPLKEIFIANGVEFTSLLNFFEGLQSSGAGDPKHHDQDWDDPANSGLWFTPNLDFMRPTVFIGKYNWAPFKDSEDNIIYEVVYREIIDPQERAYFPGRLNQNPLNNPLEPEFEPAVEYKQFNVIGNLFNNNDLSSIPEAEFLEPQSLKNLRREILEEFGIRDILDVTGENILDGIEKIPQWIQNSNGADEDGFAALIPLAYVLPGRGNDSVALLNSFDNLNIPLEIIVDRWLVKIQSETIWEDQQTIFDDINPSDNVNDPDHRTLHNTTRVDLQDNRGHYIKFKKDPTI